MRFRRNTIDYQITMDNLRWIEDVIPMTRSERRSLRSWVIDGHEIDSNPWEYRDECGILLPYLQAFRLKYGYSGGPWDHWKGPETQLFWDNDRKTFISRDDYC